MKIFILAFSLILLNCLKISAQSGIVRGRAIDSGTRKGVEFAAVALLKVKDSTLVKGSLTDSTGHFEITNLQEDVYFLVISSVEYKKFFHGPLTLTATQNNIEISELSLIQEQRILDEVVVKGEKPPFERQVDKIVMNVSSNSLYKTSTTALDVLRKAPSVQVKADGEILMRNSITPKVFIDGKDIPMNSGELKAYLNSLTPEMIETIEIITNPSAKYDAQYKGIINIRLKRDKNLGLNGSYNSTYRQHEYSAFNNNLFLTYKTKKVAYTSRIGYFDYGGLYTLSSEQKLNNGKSLFMDTRIPSFGKDLSYQLGADYTPNQHHSIGILWKGYSNREDKYTNTVSITKATNIVTQNLLTDIVATPKSLNNSLSLYYQADIKKSQLNVLGTFANFKNTELQDIKSSEAGITAEYLKSDLSNKVAIRSIQFDLTSPLAGGKLAIGSKVALTNTNNNLLFEKQQDSKFITDVTRTNEFSYDENIYAAYFNYEREFKKIGYQFGLRVENTDTKAVSVTKSTETNRNYYRILPSLGIQYIINDEQNIGISYSSRLRRPNFEELNPFRLYISPYAYAEGNPVLLPQITNILTLAYTYKSFNASLNAGTDTDLIQQLPYYDKVTNITAYVRQNTKKNDFAYTEMSHSFSPTKWWQVQHNFGLYYNNSYIIYNNKDYNLGVTSYILGGSQVFSLPNNFKLDVSYNYYSSSGDVLYIVKPLYDINLGLQKSIFKNKLNMKLNYNDIFFTSVQTASVRQSDILNSESQQRYATRRVILQLSYNFGQSTFKAKQKNRTEEENRASK
jgi:Outer membrane protein beta-barrel family/CarboxypepD_reg-like domain